MKCNEAQRLIELDLSERAGTWERRLPACFGSDLEEHLAQCQACGSSWQKDSIIINAMQGVFSSIQTPPDLEEKVRSLCVPPLHPEPAANAVVALHPQAGELTNLRLGCDSPEHLEESSPGHSITSELLRADIIEVLASLSPRERDVLRLRFGLDDGKLRTLEDVANLFGVREERIRQIEAKALRKLRHPPKTNSSSRDWVL